MRISRSEGVLCLLGVMFAGSCASQVAEDTVVAVDVQREALDLSRSCNDSFDAIYMQPRNLPRYDAGRRGDVVRCATGRRIPVDEVASGLTARGFRDIAARNAVQLYRITYRTERLSGRADVSSAIVLLPAAGRPRASVQGAETPDTADAETIGPDGIRRTSKPLIVFGHGTVPYGPSCAYSRLDPGSDMFDRELGALVAFATLGYPVIMPDYPGFVAGSPSTGYMLSEDEAHALLDATRAMKKLVRNSPDRVALVGHSQGGHAVLSAQALARSYGLSGQLTGVVALAPFWAVGRTFGAIFAPELGFTTQDNAPQLSFAIEYFYTHAELYDGPGQGAQLFKPEARAALAGFVSSCEFNTPLPAEFGTTPADFLQPDFYSAVTTCGVYGAETCSGGLAGTWESRFRADRPHLDRAGAPVLMWAGGQDVVIEPAVAKCAIDRLTADLPSGSGPASFTFCGDSAADHESLIGDQLGFVSRWIDARARGAGAPESCPGEEALQGGGPPLMCLTPPGNDD